MTHHTIQLVTLCVVSFTLVAQAVILWRMWRDR